MNEEKLRRTLLHVLDLLVQGKYEELEAFSAGRLTAAMLRQAVEEWPYRLIMPAGNELRALVRKDDIVEVERSNPQQWAMDVDLWTAEEDRSDLTLSLTLTDTPGEFYQVELDDLHVL